MHTTAAAENAMATKNTTPTDQIRIAASIWAWKE